MLLLLQMGANPNFLTYSSTPITKNSAAINDPFAEDTTNGTNTPSQDISPTFRETALHRAIRNKNEADIRAILDHKGED